MKTLILYKTKYGTAQQYAEWLKESIQDSELHEIEDSVDFMDFQTIIIISCTYMGDIRAREHLVKLWEKIKNKKVYLIAVGLVFSEDAQKTYERIPEYIRNSIQYLKIPGRIQVDKLNLMEKLVVKTMKGENLDRVDRKYLLPVIRYVKSLEN